MLGAVTFDPDGVLVDSMPLRRDALAVAFRDERISLPATADTLELSDSFDEVIAAIRVAHPTDPSLAMLDDTAHALIAARADREFSARIAAGLTVIDGAREAIRSLASECRIAVVTAWRRTEVERALTLVGLDDVVRFVISRDDGPGLASASARYRRAISRLRRAGTTGPIAALVAGTHAAAAAREAGAQAVLVGSDVLIAELTPARLNAIDTDPGLSPRVRLPPPRRS